jgi:hypothetical protein
VKWVLLFAGLIAGIASIIFGKLGSYKAGLILAALAYAMLLVKGLAFDREASLTRERKFELVGYTVVFCFLIFLSFAAFSR